MSSVCFDQLSRNPPHTAGDRGKPADLVLLEGNPVADITATQRINAVIANGRYLSRDTLDGLLADVIRVVDVGR